MKINNPTYYILILVFLFQNSIIAQDLTGLWTGYFSLEGADRSWEFEVEMIQDRTHIKGIGKQIEISSSEETRNINATFKVAGQFYNQKLTYEMNEVIFLKSPNGQCLSRCNYRFKETYSKYQLIGNCNRNGVFYKDKQYYIGHPACKTPANKKVVLSKIKKIKGREVKLLESIPIESKRVKIKIWDDNKVDGDIISINLNGVWLVKNHRISKRIKTMIFELPEKENILVFHAENMGSLPPNTAAISIWNGNERIKGLILNSDTQTSEGIRLERKDKTE